MNFLEALSEIESHEFAARVNVASDLSTFYKAAREEEAVCQLAAGLDEQANRAALLVRASRLSRQAFDLQYQNPADAPLAVYAWVMSSKDPGLAKIIAQVVIRAPQCWWAPQVSREILLERPARTQSEVIRNAFLGRPRQPVTTAHGGDTVRVVSQVSPESVLTRTGGSFIKIVVAIGARQDSTFPLRWLRTAIGTVPDLRSSGSGLAFTQGQLND